MAQAGAAPDPAPDLGPNVLLLRPGAAAATAQAAIDRIYAEEQHAEFGSGRHAILLLPGDYHLRLPVGFYAEVAGLGASPEEVRITGDLRADASAPKNNATTTFWRAAEGFALTPESGTTQWAVSQGTSLRRAHLHGSLVLHQHGGWASGGWMADTLVDGTVDSGSQQQWISRDSDWARWTGSNWNMVFVGVPHAPATAWPDPAYTTVAAAPVTREKPFLFVDAKGAWGVRVPEVRRNSSGVSWRAGETPGITLPIARFYIARPDRDTAATINAQLARGQSLLLTPGIYDLNAPIRVTRPGTVVLGLGYATLHPTHGTAALVTADADGIVLAGLLIDAGEQESPVLLEIGPPGSHARHRANPISIHDIFFRVGGAGPARARVNLEVNSSDTLIDQIWAWRADHGRGAGWTTNPSRNGVVVNGDDVTAYGLFVEHHQQFQVVWNGERGRTYLYQSEIPYDPPNQASYTSGPGTDGWASYKVADRVHTHEAWGLGIYSVFTEPDVVLTRAIEVPSTPGVRFHDMITTCLNNNGAIRNIIDDAGGAATCHPRHWPRLTLFPSAGGP